MQLTKARTYLLALTLFALLTSCTMPENYYDFPQQDRPTENVDRTVAAVGEPVIVTIQTGFNLRKTSRNASFTINHIDLGACLQSLPVGTTEIHLGSCTEKDATTYGSIRLLSNSQIVSEPKTVTVKRGEYVKVSHTFTFTSDTPNKIWVQASLRDYQLQVEGPVVSYGSGKAVEFK